MIHHRKKEKTHERLYLRSRKSYGAEIGEDYFILADEVKEHIFADRFR